ncbi:MAG: hypothetical protein RIA62_01965 [Cyclobacteriaceae bacterium]
MRATIIILFLFVAVQANSQNYIRTIDNLDAWAGQLKYDYQLLSRFDKYCRANNLLSGSLAMIDARGDNSWSYTKAVDLNNDGLQDVVFEGPSGGEPNIVYFFIQTNSGFEQVFEVMQGISKVTWKDELLDQVFVSTPGCCADFRLVNSVYQVKYDDRNRPTFSKIFQSVEVLEELAKPKNFFDHPLQFMVNNEGCELRLTPIIDNETEFHWVEITGNTFATLKQGTIGTAFAEQTDETGRIWWYVAIDLDSNVQNCILRTPDEFPTKVIGWISGRYVSKTEK